MNDLDALVRGAAIGALLLTAAFLRAGLIRRRAWIGTLYAGGTTTAGLRITPQPASSI